MNLCQNCNTDFGSVSAFDSHRVGAHEYTYSEGLRFDTPVEDGRRCLSARELGNRERTDPSTGASLGPMFARNKGGKWSLAAGLESARDKWA